MCSSDLGDRHRGDDPGRATELAVVLNAAAWAAAGRVAGDGAVADSQRALVENAAAKGSLTIVNRQAGDSDVDAGLDIEDSEIRRASETTALDGQQIRARAVDRQVLVNYQLIAEQPDRTIRRQIEVDRIT